MLTDIQESYKQVITSPIFKEEKGFLCNVFVMASTKELENITWQFGFYNPETKTMNSYKDNDGIKVEGKNDAVFQEETQPIEELKLEEVQLELEEALKLAKKHLKERHESAEKTIIVLQKQRIPIWNISFITTMFNLLNIKINGKKKQVLDEKYTSLLSFKN